jgi:glycosyltransferase involved in cell wall biosynthesis
MSAPKNQSAMKVLIFAHVPPPHHGQSYMVQLMLNGFGGDCRKNPRAAGSSPHQIECYHVDARVSKNLEDIGDMRFGKIIMIFGYCLQAIWCRFRYGVENFYFIPAPGKTSALYRDLLVMFVCRPFFKRLILHWHAAGLAKWLETAVRIHWREVTYRALKAADLCVVLSRYNRNDAEKLLPRRIKIVGNGIPDLCPDFQQKILPRRQARFAARQKLFAGQTPGPAELEAAGEEPDIFNVLFLAHCIREKGLFDSLDAVALANAHLVRTGSPVRMRLTVAGQFMNSRETGEFDERIKRSDLKITRPGVAGGGKPVEESCVNYVGFVTGDAKRRVLTESDCFCFPTHYFAESFGLVLVEAMAFGLPIVTTRWRSIPELFPADYPGLVNIRSPERVAEALVQQMKSGTSESFRSLFLQHFTLEKHLSALAEAFRSIERDDQPELNLHTFFTTSAQPDAMK